MTHLLKGNQVQNKRHFIKPSLECSDETRNELSAAGGGCVFFLRGAGRLRPLLSQGKGWVPSLARVSLQGLFTINRIK